MEPRSDHCDQGRCQKRSGEGGTGDGQSGQGCRKGGPYEKSGDCSPGTGSRTYAHDVGICERIPEQTLHLEPGKGKGCPGQSRGQHPRESQFHEYPSGRNAYSASACQQVDSA